MLKAGVDRLAALRTAIALVRRGGTISVIGVYGGMTDPFPMMTLFDKQITIRMGQANVRRWVDDIMPALTDDDPLGVDGFATHHLPIERGEHGLPDVPRQAGRGGQGRVPSRPELIAAPAQPGVAVGRVASTAAEHQQCGVVVDVRRTDQLRHDDGCRPARDHQRRTRPATVPVRHRSTLRGARPGRRCSSRRCSRAAVRRSRRSAVAAGESRSVPHACLRAGPCPARVLPSPGAGARSMTR